MAEKQLRRPTKPMMLAVNASIAGKKKDVDELAKEHKLDRDEVEQRVKLREGRPYSFTNRRRGKKVKKKAAKPIAAPADILSMIDGRTKILTLLEIDARVNELLSKKTEEDVARVRSSLRKVEKLERELKEARATLGQ